jgi:transposase
MPSSLIFSKEAQLFKGSSSQEFKRDAAVHIVERGDRVAQVSQGLTMSQYSLFGWKKKFAKTASSSGDERDSVAICPSSEHLAQIGA